MDPVQKIWMFQNWIADQNDQAELAKNHAYLLGSFSNPEAVKQLMGTGNNHDSTEQELEESSDMVKEGFYMQLPHLKNVNLPPSSKENNIIKKRRRRTLKE